MNACYDQKCSLQSTRPMANSPRDYSDKENQNSNPNAMPNPQVDDHWVISGIKALGSDNFLSKFENVKEDLKNPRKSAFTLTHKKMEKQVSSYKSNQDEKDQDLACLKFVSEYLEGKYSIKIH